MTAEISTQNCAVTKKNVFHLYLKACAACRMSSLIIVIPYRVKYQQGKWNMKVQ